VYIIFDTGLPLGKNVMDFNIFILSRKLDQDILENVFRFLKGMAGRASNNITVLDFKYW